MILKCTKTYVLSYLKRVNLILIKSEITSKELLIRLRIWHILKIKTETNSMGYTIIQSTLWITCINIKTSVANIYINEDKYIDFITHPQSQTRLQYQVSNILRKSFPFGGGVTNYPTKALASFPTYSQLFEFYFPFK